MSEDELRRKCVLNQVFSVFLTKSEGLIHGRVVSFVGRIFVIWGRVVSFDRSFLLRRG